MIDGQQIRDARERAGLTQQQLGQAVGVGQRTVGNWERGETVPRNREAAIRSVLADHLGAPGESPLRGISDVELIAELARRLGRARARKEGDPSGDTAATSTPGGDPGLSIAEVSGESPDRLPRPRGASQHKRGDDRHSGPGG